MSLLALFVFYTQEVNTFLSYVIRTNKKHTFCINVLLIIVSPTCFQPPNDHPQEDFYMQFYGISFMHPYKQSGRWQGVLDA